MVLISIRLGLGLAGLAGAMLAGPPRSAALGFAFGGLGSLIALLADPRYGHLRRYDPVPLPAAARSVSLMRVAASGVFPSTVGVALLCVVALYLNPTLAAVLAGILLGMALAGTATWLRLEVSDRREGNRLFVEYQGKRVFAEPR